QRQRGVACGGRWQRRVRARRLPQWTAALGGNGVRLDRPRAIAPGLTNVGEQYGQLIVAELLRERWHTERSGVPRGARSVAAEQDQPHRIDDRIHRDGAVVRERRA